MSGLISNLIETESTEEVLFSYYVQQFKVISIQEITENGIYKKDEIPEDYGGAVLQVEIVHAMYMSDRTGKMIKMEFDIPEAMDKDDKTGGPYNLDGVEIKEQSGDSAVPTELITIDIDPTAESVTEQVKKTADYVKTNYDEIGFV